ncbi:MAG: hypothetical protein N2Z23_07310 [Pyrinomonadaceae bacterium]|nr:hypothetical protein [Pyrinomonadaceae bacterium]MCX7640232.1 hypothetical protein [Pyrinomonadaceae bacterium]MDW8305144.1 hypothetical protein [Acidobacteriota bacterium]
MELWLHAITWSIIGLVVSALLTFSVCQVARRFGFVVSPRSDRWHKKPTATFGGVAIFLTVTLLSFSFLELNSDSMVILIGSTWLFLVGLIDDIFNIKPYQKLLGQIFGALLIIGNGLVLNWTDSIFVNSAITFFWIIGITNAVNLLDNMDGLAAGISAIASVVILFTLVDVGQLSEITLISIFIGALLGFLIFNFNPASIFMGDCGSMFIGFFLACSILVSQNAGRFRSILSVLAVPVLTLFVPVFDTTFVTLLRKLKGRSISQGGRDHTSHRLVALGLSEKKAVLLLYGLAVTAGGLALAVLEMDIFQSIALISLFMIVLVFLGVYLAKVKVYEEDEKEIDNALFTFLIDISYKRRIFEIFLDFVLICLVYYASFTTVFGSIEEDEQKWNFFVNTLPLVIFLKLVAFLIFGIYRGIWRYTTVKDSVKFAKAVLMGSVLSVVAIFFLYENAVFTRSVFVLDAILLFIAVTASRLSFRVFRQLLPYPIVKDARKVLIYGAGDAGEMVLREIYNNPDLNYLPVGFIDDDETKQGKTIHGLKVFGTNGLLSKVCKENQVQEILISCRKIKPENLQRVKKFCKSENIALKKAELKIENIGFE